MGLYAKPEDLPVILITYNRPGHTARVIQALRQFGVKNLRIYSDAPRSIEQNAKVAEVRNLIRTIDWTTPQVFEQNENQGLARSIASAVDDAFQTEEFIILLEDDCVPQQHFFQFMFDCYERYRDNKKIFGVSGYTVALSDADTKDYPYDLYFSPRIGSWGWGTWKDKWAHHERDLLDVARACLDGNISLHQGGTDIPETLAGLLSGSVKDVWTIHWVLSVYLQQGVFIYPTRSHIDNIGMDGSGVHCGVAPQFQTPAATEAASRFPEDVIFDEKIFSRFRSYYDIQGGEHPKIAFDQLSARFPRKTCGVVEVQKQNPRILHIIHALALGGSTRAMVGIGKFSKQQRGFEHAVASLTGCPNPNVIPFMESQGLSYTHCQDWSEIKREMEKADIVHIHWWNSPEMQAFLHSELPPCRMLCWIHVGGYQAPQEIPDELMHFVDFALACSPYTYTSPAFQKLPEQMRLEKTGMAYGPADFDRLKDFKPKPHAGFNVGYIGEVDFIKMHPQFASMSCAAKVPEIKFILAGKGGASYALQQQVAQLGASARFDFRGYVENVVELIGEFDVFGYPLCEETYAASELVLQEVMYAGIPPVVFPHGGIRDLVHDNYTGIVVRGNQEYAQALEYLYHHPEERARIGKNAREYAQQIFGAERASEKICSIYDRLMAQPKASRRWGNTERQSIPFEQASGAEKFLQTLVNSRDSFVQSLQSNEMTTIIESDIDIMNMNDLFWAGGVLPFKNYYQGDPHLLFWSGLAQFGREQYEGAAMSFLAAIQNGFTHCRALWYLQKSLEILGKAEDAAAVRRLTESNQSLIDRFEENFFEQLKSRANIT